jgi:hypothetical protein
VVDGRGVQKNQLTEKTEKIKEKLTEPNRDEKPIKSIFKIINFNKSGSVSVFKTKTGKPNRTNQQILKSRHLCRGINC